MTGITQIYDRFADSYDETYNTPDAKAEDLEVVEALELLGQLGRICDIGCGTGILADFIKTKMNGQSETIQTYLGFDPSMGMLKEFQRKHSSSIKGIAISLVNSRLEEFSKYRIAREFDTVISLYGSISYVKPEAFSDFIEEFYGNIFLMFYEEGYRPDYLPENVKTYSARDYGFDVAFKINSFDVVVA